MLTAFELKSVGRAATIVVAAVLVPLSGIQPAQARENAIHRFDGSPDGAMPSSGLIADANGNFFGATLEGGTATNCGSSGCGTVYEIKKGGGESVLYSFQDENDGASPSGSLLLDNTGNLYGAARGGTGTNCDGYGCGTIFRLAPSGTLGVLYTFQGGSDGYFPTGRLIADSGGNLYGTTGAGGDYNGECAENESGCGTVFEVEPNGTKITLYDFQGGSDGDGPTGGLAAGTSGNLYGTTYAGGVCSTDAGGCGTVFKITPGGTESVIYAFQGGTDGEFPAGGVIIDAADNLYGTTAYGGSQSTGTVFKVAPNGTEMVLYSFKGGKDGANPEAGLVMDSNGNIYGTTYAGGNSKCSKAGFTGCGTVFELTANGKEKVLYRFPGKNRESRGANPAAPLLLGSNGSLYGTAPAGGTDNNGVAFSVK
ncbi:MAG: choice-of-anchor tandem repeat GloVer-containing protein [Rhizomicrobium sp.]|jgi:uncharacterized repeat protein (TIGR03803 family)